MSATRLVPRLLRSRALRRGCASPARVPLAPLLLVASLLLTSPPARAGHWDLQATCTQQPTADLSFTSQVGGGHFQIGPCHGSASTGRGQTASASMTATITLTATWAPDGDPASNPPPSGLVLEESATTSWSGSSSAGQAPTGSSGNPVGGDETPMSPLPSGSFASNAGGRRQGHAFTMMSASGGTATLTRVFTGSASAASSPQNGCSATAGLDGYSGQIHSQSYGRKRAASPGKDPTGQDPTKPVLCDGGGGEGSVSGRIDQKTGNALLTVADPTATRGYPLVCNISLNSQAVETNRPMGNATFTDDIHVTTGTIYDQNGGGSLHWLLVDGDGTRLDFGLASGAPAAGAGIFSHLAAISGGYQVWGAGPPEAIHLAGGYS